MAPSLPIKGFQVKVVYDPDDHSKILIEEDQIFPPGISHEQAEKSAACRKQMRAAAASGNMASYIEEDIRAKALVAISLTDVQIHRDLALVFRKDKSLSRAARAFMDIALKQKNFAAAADPKRSK